MRRFCFHFIIAERKLNAMKHIVIIFNIVKVSPSKQVYLSEHNFYLIPFNFHFVQSIVARIQRRHITHALKLTNIPYNTDTRHDVFVFLNCAKNADISIAFSEDNFHLPTPNTIILFAYDRGI